MLDRLLVGERLDKMSPENSDRRHTDELIREIHRDLGELKETTGSLTVYCETNTKGVKLLFEKSDEHTKDISKIKGVFSVVTTVLVMLWTGLTAWMFKK